MNLDLWDRLRDWVILLGLLLISISVLLTQNEPALRGLRARALNLTAGVEESFAWMGDFVRALDENDRLRAQNIQLSSEVARSRADRILNRKLQGLLAMQDSSNLPLRPVHIVSKNNLQTSFIIDAGSSEGLEYGMAVVDTRGILGKIELVSEHYAEVISYRNIDFRVPAQIQPLLVDGIVSWEGKRQNQMLMELVVKTEPVEKGQLVVTSGYSGSFPAGYPIGTVDSVAVRPGRGELLIYVEPRAPMDDAIYAFVVLRKVDFENLTSE